MAPVHSLVTSLLALVPLVQEGEANWPHLRGPAFDGASSVEAPDAARLEAAWRRPLGPAYAGVVVSGQRAFTFASDGALDLLLALDVEDGSELWRHSFGPTYLGHDGSEDGPIATPTVGGGLVFAVGAHGRLAAFDVRDGAERWSVELAGELGASEPDYGFASTPLVDSGLLYVQAGGSEGRGLCAFDAASGELRWSHASAPAGYQSPVIMDLAGTRQLVVLNEDTILGLDPADGSELWRHALGAREDASSGVATRLDDEHFVAVLGRGLGCVRVRRGGAGFETETVYTTRELGGSYAAPVHFEGHLYGFNRSFLTCVDAANGERVWKSRPPGGTGLILLGDRLVVFGAEGVVALARATPEGYVEEHRIEALDHSSYTWPSFSRGRLLVRSTSELACLRLVPAEAVPEASARADGQGAAQASHLLSNLEREVLASADGRARIDEFLARQADFPVLADGMVHFLFRGDVHDLAVAGSMTGGRPEPMRRIEGTDLFWRSYPIEPGARWEYQFQVDFGPWSADPLNPLQSPQRRGDAPMSEVLTPEYSRPDHGSDGSQGDGGRLDKLRYVSEQLGNERDVEVYLPRGYDDGEAAYPLLIVHQGAEWIERGRLVQTLDALTGASVRPLVVAFVDPIDAWWHEAGGTGTEEYLAMLATEFVPWLEARYRLSGRAGDRALMGTRAFGLTAVYGAVLHPEVFGKAGVQSASLDDVARHALFAELEAGPAPALEFYVDWNRYEALDPDNGVDLRADGLRLRDALVAAGYAPAGGEALDGHGWGSWRARSGDLLEALFPMP